MALAKEAKDPRKKIGRNSQVAKACCPTPSVVTPLGTTTWPVASGVKMQSAPVPVANARNGKIPISDRVVCILSVWPCLQRTWRWQRQ